MLIFVSYYQQLTHHLAQSLKQLRCVFLLIGLMGGGLFTSFTAQAGEITGYVLRIELTPAKCLIDKDIQKQRQCLEGYNFTILGLYPEVNQLNCISYSSAALSPLQERAIARIMPNETRRKQLWHDVGGCVAGKAGQYFRQIAILAEAFNIPTLLVSDRTTRIQLPHLRQQIIQQNGVKFPAHAVQFGCQYRLQQSYLTELKVCYNAQLKYRNCPPTMTSNCSNTVIIQGVY